MKKLSEKCAEVKPFPAQYEFQVKYIVPLTSIAGIVYLTDERIYMQPFHPQVLAKPVVNIRIDRLSELFKRRYTLMDIGLELVAKKADPRKKKTMFLVFNSTHERDAVYNALLQGVGSRRHEIATTEKNVEFYTQKWVHGNLTNFEYLMFLNSYAQRSFQDLTQYPVMPWVLRDYKSNALDLQNPAVFRDLSKPIGALNPERLADFRTRWKETPPEMDRFLYGSHFSCPGYVIGFHLRSHPQWMIKFQSGRFDNPNRMFKGINKEWKSCLENPTNVKELIPEFYMDDASFLENRLALDLGVRSNGKRVEHVKLPTWASSAEDFLKKNRQALESEHVSNNLHKWIDLVFGAKQNSI